MSRFCGVQNLVRCPLSLLGRYDSRCYIQFCSIGCWALVGTHRFRHLDAAYDFLNHLDINSYSGFFFLSSSLFLSQNGIPLFMALRIQTCFGSWLHGKGLDDTLACQFSAKQRRMGIIEAVGFEVEFTSSMKKTYRKIGKSCVYPALFIYICKSTPLGTFNS